jgi:hypothetical protein
MRVYIYMRVTDAAAYGFSPKQSRSWQRFSLHTTTHYTCVLILRLRLLARAAVIFNFFFFWQLVAQLAALLALAARQPRVAAQLPLASAGGTYRRLFRVARDKCVVGTAVLQSLEALLAGTLLYCCFTAALLLLYFSRRSRRSSQARSFTAALLLLYCCFTSPGARGAPRRYVYRLRRYSGAIKALLRLYSGAIEALLRLYAGSIERQVCT